MGFNAEEYYRSLGGSGQMPQWLKDASKTHGQPRKYAIRVDPSSRQGTRGVNYIGGNSVPMTDNEQIRYHKNAQIIADNSGNKTFVNPLKGALNQKDDKFVFGGKQYQWQLQDGAGTYGSIAQQAFKDNVYKPEGATLQQLQDTVAIRNQGNNNGKQYVPVEIGSGINRSFGQDEVQRYQKGFVHSSPAPSYQSDGAYRAYQGQKGNGYNWNTSMEKHVLDGLNGFLSRVDKQAKSLLYGS